MTHGITTIAGPNTKFKIAMAAIGGAATRATPPPAGVIGTNFFAFGPLKYLASKNAAAKGVCVHSVRLKGGFVRP
jgi:hypothetical protein